jgi:4-amino-4-deoxychorismate lyase
MSNLFIRSGSYLMTPILDRCGIAGVMRRWVLEQAKDCGLRPLEGRLSWEQIGEAEEAFMTNAVAGVVSVALFQDGAERVRLHSQDGARALRARLEAL